MERSDSHTGECENDARFSAYPIADVDEDINHVDEKPENWEGLCISCRKSERDYSKNSRSALCSECRQEHLKLRIPQSIKLFLAFVCAIFVLSLAMFPPILSNYRTYLKAEKSMQAREYVLAYMGYSALPEEYGESTTIIIKAADAAMNAQYFGYLAETLDTYLVGKTLNDSDYAKVMSYDDLLNNYYYTLSEIEAITAEISSGSISGEEDEILKVFTGKLEELLFQNNIDNTLIYFYLGNYSADANVATSYLKHAVEFDSKFTYPYAYYGNALRRMDKKDEAEQVYLEAIALNANDALSLRGLSILQLLDGKKELALQTIQYAHELEPFGTYIPEALIIALCENGRRDEAMTLMEEYIGYGVQFYADLQEYLNAEISVEQYYVY